MNKKSLLLACLITVPVSVNAAPQARAVQQKRLTEADRKVAVGRILLKWGGYVESIRGQDRRTWAAALWPSLASADLDNLQKALLAVTYEGMRNALLGQTPNDDQIIDRMARAPKAGGATTKALGSLAEDLVFNPITPCRIADTRVHNNRIDFGMTRALWRRIEQRPWTAQDLA